MSKMLDRVLAITSTHSGGNWNVEGGFFASHPADSKRPMLRATARIVGEKRLIYLTLERLGRAVEAIFQPIKLVIRDAAWGTQKGTRSFG